MFHRYIGIDYSGAETPTSSLKGLRVYCATPTSAAVEILPPSGPRKYWTRRGVSIWLREQLSGSAPVIVGIDHGFSFPIAYFEKHALAHDWEAFLEDFQHHWPTHENVYVDFIRDGSLGNGQARQGNNRWKRVTELRAGAAKSVFHFDVQGSVAKSTHAGLPWLLYVRKNASRPIHFWPFDGWDVPTGVSVIAEVYPALWNRQFSPEDRTSDQHDAYSIAEWLRQADQSGDLKEAMNPVLSDAERRIAAIEGWILGVVSSQDKAARQNPARIAGQSRESSAAVRAQLAQEAKAIVALAFRNGPIESIHSGKECPTCAGQSSYSRITDDEMKAIMKNAVDRVYQLLRMKSEDPGRYDDQIEFGNRYTRGWGDPDTKS